VNEPRVLAEGLGFTEGPVWTRDGRLLVTSISHGVIYEVGLDGTTSVFATTSGGPNGMTEGAGGRLYVAQNGGIFEASKRSKTSAKPGIQLIDSGTVTYLADDGLGAPNDLCFGPDGRLYFTDPRGWARPDDIQPGRVFAMALDGVPELLAEGPAFTNGITFGPDASDLFVSVTFERRVLRYRVLDGRLDEPEEYCKIDPGMPDGMCFDSNGRLYVAATIAEEVQVFDTSGTLVDRLPCGENSMLTNGCFGGPENNTLFVTDARRERVLAFDLDVAGLPLFPFRPVSS
jgi:gluconolactonase